MNREYTLFDDIRSVGRRYEEVQHTVDFYDYPHLKRKAERMVGKDIASKMSADEIINLVAGR